MAKRVNNSKTKKDLENSAVWGLPGNYPMSGIFDVSQGGGTPAAASLPFEMANANSYNLISLQRLILAYAYVMHGPLRTMVDQPVKDAFRGGIKVKSDEVSPEDIEKLHKELKRIQYFKKVSLALQWARLFGGAGMIINIGEDYSKELDVNKIKDTTMLGFKVADRWELVWEGIPDAPNTMFSFYGKKVHPSRVAKALGDDPPSIVSQRLQGWGMSVIECVLRELNTYFKQNNVLFEVIDEYKIDVWKIAQFNANVLSKLAAGQVHRRIQMSQMLKNYLNAVVLDKEDDFEQKTMSFSGIAEILKQIQIGIAAACRMPMAKLFGLSASGFSSGEDDIENYNAIVENVRTDADSLIEATLPAVCMKVWGFIPDDLTHEYKSLRILSAEQEENVKNSKFNRASSLYNQGILNPVEYCELLKQDGVLTMETEVGRGTVEPEPPMAGLMDEAGAGEGGEGKGSAKAKSEKESEG